MDNMKKEGENIQERIEKLGKELTENYRKAEELANLETCKAVSETKPKENNLRVSEFLTRTIEEKKAVCFETAQIPIFMCSEMHLICNLCCPKVRECPECHLSYTGAAKRHKFAERTAGELEKLKLKFENLTA
jgi:hypothetical protein